MWAFGSTKHREYFILWTSSNFRISENSKAPFKWNFLNLHILERTKSFWVWRILLVLWQIILLKAEIRKKVEIYPPFYIPNGVGIWGQLFTWRFVCCLAYLSNLYSKQWISECWHLCFPAVIKIINDVQYHLYFWVLYV